MAANNNNQKLPDSDAKWEYPHNHVTQTAGGHEIHYNCTPGEESYRLLHPYGTYTEISKDGKKVEHVANKHYDFVSNGHSSAVEGSRDSYTKGGSRVTNDSGVHRETGDHDSHAIYGQSLKVSKQTAYQHSVETINHVGEAGQFTDFNDGDHHTNVLGDKVTFVDGTKYEQVNGEHGTHIPNGNMDIQIDGGKLRIHSGNAQLYDCGSNITINSAANVAISASEVTITASTKITLVVGSTKITITSSDITLQSSGTIHANASGDVITQGATTKVQGGGVHAPPTTFS